MSLSLPRFRLLFLAAALALLGAPSFAIAGEITQVDGFTVRYESVTTPKKDWEEPDAAANWLSRFKGRLESTRPIAYRKQQLPAGKHDLWVERGKDDWFFLVIGNQADSEKPRLRAQFKLYDREEGVEKIEFNLKLVRKATKLKFSLLAGACEGHGNIRIVAGKKETP